LNEQFSDLNRKKGYVSTAKSVCGIAFFHLQIYKKELSGKICKLTTEHLCYLEKASS